MKRSSRNICQDFDFEHDQSLARPRLWSHCQSGIFEWPTPTATYNRRLRHRSIVRCSFHHRPSFRNIEIMPKRTPIVFDLEVEDKAPSVVPKAAAESRKDDLPALNFDQSLSNVIQAKKEAKKEAKSKATKESDEPKAKPLRLRTRSRKKATKSTAAQNDSKPKKDTVEKVNEKIKKRKNLSLAVKTQMRISRQRRQNVQPWEQPSTFQMPNIQISQVPVPSMLMPATQVQPFVESNFPQQRQQSPPPLRPSWQRNTSRILDDFARARDSSLSNGRKGLDLDLASRMDPREMLKYVKDCAHDYARELDRRFPDVRSVMGRLVRTDGSFVPCDLYNQNDSCPKDYIHFDANRASRIHSCTICYFSMGGMVNMHRQTQCPLLTLLKSWFFFYFCLIFLWEMAN